MQQRRSLRSQVRARMCSSLASICNVSPATHEPSEPMFGNIQRFEPAFCYFVVPDMRSWLWFYQRHAADPVCHLSLSAVECCPT